MFDENETYQLADAVAGTFKTFDLGEEEMNEINIIQMQPSFIYTYIDRENIKHLVITETSEEKLLKEIEHILKYGTLVSKYHNPLIIGKILEIHPNRFDNKLEGLIKTKYIVHNVTTNYKISVDISKKLE